MKKDKKSWKFFLQSKIPTYVLFIVTAVLAGALIISVLYKPHKDSEITLISPGVVSTDCQIINQIRETDYTLIKPLLLTETNIESDALQSVKENINHFISQKKQEGVINSASVYIRELTRGTWISINKDELFSPGSIMKIPTLISILAEAERTPSILEKKVFFKKHFSAIPEQTITGTPIKEGTYYTVKDLLYYMIVNSDNDATALLNQTLDFNIMQKLFKDLQLPIPNNKQWDYQINVADCSRFIRVLYNATYLNKEMSQYALDLLTKSAYKEGIIKDMDPNVLVAHKFGERNTDGEQQLHEMGIIYYDHNPYLLAIMTKGKNNKILPEIISTISDIVFQSMKINS